MEHGRRLKLTSVLDQHAEEARDAWHRGRLQRSAAPSRLAALARLDEQLAAHLDGLLVAADDGSLHAKALLEDVSGGAVFVNTFIALMRGDVQTIKLVCGLSSLMPAAFSGACDAACWAGEPFGEARLYLDAVHGEPLLRAMQIVRTANAGAARRVRAGCLDPSPLVRRIAARQIAMTDIGGAASSGSLAPLPELEAMFDDADPFNRTEALRSAVLRGDRRAALRDLAAILPERDRGRGGMATLALRALPLPQANSIASALASDGEGWRMLMSAVGAAGDPKYIDWLISRMREPRQTRAAGEAFSLITGVDLAWLDLEGKPLEGLETNPNDNPDDDDVAMDEDDGLPWPDPARVQAWWSANSHRFQPGVRYFMGAPPSWDHCLQVLRDGYQRQRIAAAEYLCLLRPGTVLFNCEAPAWRQQRWLAQMQ